MRRLLLITAAVLLAQTGCSKTMAFQPGQTHLNAMLGQLDTLAETAQKGASDCAALTGELDTFFTHQGGELGQNAEMFNRAEDPNAARTLVDSHRDQRDASLNSFMDVVNNDCAGNLGVAKYQQQLRGLLGQGAPPQNGVADMSQVYQKRIDGFCSTFKTRVTEAMGSPNMPNCSAVKDVMLEMSPKAASLDLRNLPNDQISACDATLATLYNSGCQAFPEVNDTIILMVGTR